MTPQEFNFSLLIDRVRFTLESIEMYRPSFEGGNPSMPVVDRIRELFLQTHENFKACRDALEASDLEPTHEIWDKWEALQVYGDNLLEDFQTMIRAITFKKLEDLL